MLGIMLDMTQKHKHLPSLHMTTSMVKVWISRVMHYKMIETIAKEHLCSMIVQLKKSMDSRIS